MLSLTQYALNRCHRFQWDALALIFGSVAQILDDAHRGSARLVFAARQREAVLAGDHWRLGTAVAVLGRAGVTRQSRWVRMIILPAPVLFSLLNKNVDRQWLILSSLDRQLRRSFFVLNCLRDVRDCRLGLTMPMLVWNLSWHLRIL